MVLKNTIKKSLQQCVTCLKPRPKLSTYMMGNLPPARVTPTRVFYNCSVDYTGRFNIKEKAL